MLLKSFVSLTAEFIVSYIGIMIARIVNIAVLQLLQ